MSLESWTLEDERQFNQLTVRRQRFEAVRQERFAAVIRPLFDETSWAGFTAYAQSHAGELISVLEPYARTGLPRALEEKQS